MKLAFLRSLIFIVSLTALHRASAEQTICDSTILYPPGGNAYYYRFYQGDTIAQGFDVLDTAVHFHSVTLNPIESSDANGGEVAVSLWSGNGEFPEALIENLGTVTLTPGDDANSDSHTLESYEHPLLLPGMRYWIVVELVSGTFQWGFYPNDVIPEASTALGTLVSNPPLKPGGIDFWESSNQTNVMKCLIEAPDVITVENTNDEGDGSLRQAIADSSAEGAILFDPSLSGKTIRLTSGELNVDKSLIIDASNLSDGVTISGDANGNGPDEADSRIFNLAAGTEIILDSLTVTGGHAIDSGGGIRSEGDSLIVRRCNILDNGTSDGVGPGYAGHGGGIAMFLGDLKIDSSTIAGNSTGKGRDYESITAGRGGHGGGIYMEGLNEGGGNYNISELLIVNSTISANKTGAGGNGHPVDAEGGIPGMGGALYFTLGKCYIRNSTIVRNEAGPPGEGNGMENFAYGAGGVRFVYVDPLIFSDSVIAENVIPPGGFAKNIVRSYATITSEGGNFIGEYLTSSELPAGQPNGNGDYVGTSSNPLDPLLGPLADNGGPTLTHFPLADSPLRDPAGGRTTSLFTLDQRGFDRIGYGTLDIGAVEFTPEDQANIDAEAARQAALAAQASAQLRAAALADLQRKLKKLKKKFKKARRAKKVAKAKKLKKQIRAIKIQLRSV